MVRAVSASRRGDRRTADRTRADVVVRFACAKKEHLAIPGGLGCLVSHHGTFGYCPARTAGLHEWKDIQGVRLSDLRRTEAGRHLGY